MLVVHGDRGGHVTLPVCGDAVEAAAGDLGDKAVASQFGDEAAGLGAAAFGFGVVAWRQAVEVGLEVFVAEPVDEVLAGESGAEQREVAGGDGVEPGVSFASVSDGPAVVEVPRFDGQLMKGQIGPGRRSVE
jgi:hypothetical protein